MRVLAFLGCYLALAALLATGAMVLFDSTRVVKIDEDVTLVTLDALPDHVIVVEHNDVHVTKVNRPKPVPKPAPATPSRPAPVESVTLPASCPDIKYYSAHFTHDQLEAMRVAAHLPKPSAAQARAIAACLAS